MALRGNKHQSTGGRGSIFQPHFVISKLSSSKYEKHHKNLLGLVYKLPQTHKATFTVHDLMNTYWKGEVGPDPNKCSMIIQIIARTGILDQRGMSNSHNRVWCINSNFLKFIAYMKHLEGKD